MSLPVPGLVFGTYPERTLDVPRPGPRPGVLPVSATSGRYVRAISRAQARRNEIAELPVPDIDDGVRRLRAQFSRYGLSDELIAEAFAFVSVLCRRTLRMQPHDHQLLAAHVMLDNRMAEMATGEGKTLAAGVCAATAGLAGVPVHVITSNDYLVTRDANRLRPLFEALGLRVDVVTQDMKLDERRRAYGADITYCTAKELVFDYLRDALDRTRGARDLHARVAQLSASSPRLTLLRGLCMAIVDEADSVLLDEARVPLILARQTDAGPRPDTYAHALVLATSLKMKVHFRLDHASMAAVLTDAGSARVEAMRVELNAGGARNRLHREEIVRQALAALHLYKRDQHYIVRDDQVIIIDETTGRAAQGRAWSRGLHQLIECKEGCKVSNEQVTARQITYQRFFRKYLSLGGMSGTLQEARKELRSVYGLDVVRVPLRSPDRRVVLPTRMFSDRDSMWRAVIDQARRCQGSGQPLLIGTDSVADSESLSTRLTEAGIQHRVLNARQDRAEADIVGKAGRVGNVTVATNMAGRGTDIPLGPGASERGGLHVISCQHNASRRIDRQLIGRCARQGDPGSAQTFLCRDHALIKRDVPRWLVNALAGAEGRQRPQWLIATVRRIPQILEERRQRTRRRAMLEQDINIDRALAGTDCME